MRMFVDFLASAVEFGVNGWAQMQVAFQNFGAWFGETAQKLQQNWDKILRLMVTAFSLVLLYMRRETLNNF